MNRDAATPGEDFKVSAAGPLATLGVILVCLAIDVAIVGPHRLTHAIALDQDITITPVLLSLSWLLPMNVLLLVFNLMPAYPLDGGRIARSIIWRVTGSKRTGTIISAQRLQRPFDGGCCAGFRLPAMTRLSACSGGRRLKSAKAGNRGGWGTIVQRALWGIGRGASRWEG